MDGNYLLDTNIVIALLEKDRTVKRRLRQAPAVAVPSIVIGELTYGALNSAHVAENLDRLEDFVAASEILPCDLDTARRYGEIKSGAVGADAERVRPLNLQQVADLVKHLGHFGVFHGSHLSKQNKKKPTDHR